MTRRVIGGRVFTFEGDDRLSIRQTWPPYLVGCVVAAATFAAGVLWLAWLIRHPPGATVDATRTSPGHLVAWEEQTWGQRFGSAGSLAIPAGAMVVLSVAYVIAGAEARRKPFVLDRATAVISCRGVQLCKVSDVLRVRVVYSPGGSFTHYKSRFDTVLGANLIGHGRGGTGGTAPGTNVFLRLSSAPWSIQLDNPERLANEYALAIAEFLGVEAVDDPLLIPGRYPRPDPPGPPGFPVIPPRSDS